MSNLNRTPLFEEHLKLGARMVGFAGWEMPIQYKGLKEEHLCVRHQVGLFDVSHMGEIFVKGPQSLETLQWLTTNDVSILKKGEAQYSLLPNDQGGLVDDIIVYCLEPNQNYLVCVNAANTAKDFDWMIKHNRGADITNASGDWAQIAVQGPKATALLEEVTGLSLQGKKAFTFFETQIQNCKAIVALTGYTGESGGEIFIEKSGAVALWQDLLKKGEKHQVQAIGLGARDTLRTEMKYSLYGHEIDDHSNPYESGLGWVVKPAAKDFLGKSLILSKKEKGLERQLVGFKMLEKGIPRQDYPLVDEKGQVFGKVTSGTHSPSLDEPIGIGFVPTQYSKVGTPIWVDIRGRKVKAEVCPTPFIKR